MSFEQHDIVNCWSRDQMIDLYSASSNLGDNLSLTPLMRATPCRIHLYDDASVRAVAPIFDGLAEVLFDNGSPITTGPRASPQAPIRGPHSAKTLAHFGYSTNAIPSIKLTDQEIAWARHFLADSQLINCCVIKSSTQKANYRTPPADLMQRIVDANLDIQFVTSALSTNHPKNNFDHVPLKRVLTMWDYPIRKLAALYHVIGRYVGPDTGDYHLMLSVGGKADVLVPDSRWDYNHIDFHYRDEDFAPNVPRARYHRWTQSFAAPINDINLP